MDAFDKPNFFKFTYPKNPSPALDQIPKANERDDGCFPAKDPVNGNRRQCFDGRCDN